MNPPFRLIVLLVAAVPAFTPAIAATAEQVSSAAAAAPTQFARIARDADGKPEALQLAIVTYEPGNGASDFSVDLISAVHIGDRAYYQGLNDRFREYDALLYEMIIPDDAGAAQEPGRGFNVIASTQIGMKDMLGLAFQLDEIDYGAANFVHADLTSDMLAQSMADRGESLYVYFWRLVYQAIDEYASDPLGLRDWRLLSSMLSTEDDALKIAMAYEMVKATRTGDVLGGETGSALLAGRNAHAVRVLQDQIEAGGKRIGIFYGAAHMTDFEQRLLNELTLSKVKVEWVDAWRFAAEGKPTPAPGH
ncbi:MAG: hypothetical protein ACREQ8_17700 [Woeseiaceae bacterium]